MTASSYAWQHRLDEAVPDAGVVTVETPGFLAASNYNTDETSVVLDGTVFTRDQAPCVWAGDFTSVDVTNDTGSEWQPAQTLYVTVAKTVFDPADVQAGFEALEARVSANEAAITTLNEDVDALDERVTTLESNLALDKEHQESKSEPKKNSTKAKEHKPHVKSSPTKKRR
jgi:hypothetical protein